MPLVTKAAMAKTAALVSSSPYVARTPLVDITPTYVSLRVGSNPGKVYLKLESLQTTGSFKIRGVVAQMRSLPPHVKGVVTLSAGNYGKAVSDMSAKMGIKAVICVPDTAPIERVKMMESLGAVVARTSTANLMNKVKEIEKELGYHFLHPFDDMDIISGYATCGKEILEDLPDADVVLCPCGGGGIISGISAAMKLSGSKARIVGVEPEGAPKMFESRKAGEALSMPNPKTIAAGLAPPFAGKITFEHVQAYTDDLTLISDEEIVRAVKMLSGLGLVVEPSGAAAFAALISGKLGDLSGKKVVCVITGSNIALPDLAKL